MAKTTINKLKGERMMGEDIYSGARADVILMIDYKDIVAINTALEVLRERDNQDKKGMYVAPNKITDAIHNLTWLKRSIEKELEGVNK